MLKKFKQYIQEKIITENSQILNRCLDLIKTAYSTKEDYLTKLETIDNKRIRFFVFSGTKTRKDLMFDLIPGLQSVDQEHKEHKVWNGFLQKSKLFVNSVINTIQEDSKQDDKITYVFTGHSLGAALAAIIYVQLHKPGKLVLIGSPQIGNLSFFKELFSGDDDWIKHNIHIVYLQNNKHEIDFISQLPPLHIIPNLTSEFNDYLDLLLLDKNKYSFLDLHHFDNYKKEITDYLSHHQ